MSTSIFIAKYVSDPARWEPRNVGVFVLGDDDAQGRFLGEGEDASIDGRTVRYSVGAPAEVYREWVRYWRRTVLEERLDPTALPVPAGATFFIAKAGELWQDMDRPTTDQLVERYFARLVQDAEQLGAHELRAQVEEVIERTNLLREPSFRRDVTIESVNLDPPETYRFDYAYQNRHLTVGQPVWLGHDHMIHDALWKYQHIAEGVEKVSLVHGLSGELARPAFRLLQGASTVIDVADPDAVAQVREVFAA